MDLYGVLVGDFVEACLNQWNTFDPAKLWDYVANHKLEALCVPTLPMHFALPIDAQLRSNPAYIGAVVPDLGNPLHRHLFLEMMFKDAFIAAGHVTVQAGPEGDYAGIFSGADTFSDRGMIVLPYEQFEAACPSNNLPESLSARGLVTQMRVQRRMARDIHEKLAQEMLGVPEIRDATTPLEWDLRHLPDSQEEVQVQSKKLTEYLLNTDHAEGKSKAEFFEKELGITHTDWSFLQAQFIDGLANASYENIRLDQYGIRFSAVIPVTGRNGATATVHTAWIVRSKERASLVTAYPSQKNEALEFIAITPAVVPPNLSGDDRWESIFDLADKAGNDAAEKFVPKPMVVEGSVYMDGECGGAFIVVKDARRGFARWLMVTKRGDQHYPTGYAVAAPQRDQSADRAEAYANAFATVLRRNGVECRVEKYLT